MKSACFQRKLRTNQPGFVVLLMLLIIVVVCGLLWLDPFALSGSKDKSLPWNQLKRIVPDDEVVPSPTEQQPKFTTHMRVIAECKENEQDRGKVEILITPQGRVSGSWFADYFPKQGLRYEVVASSFKGNIAPEYAYKDDYGEDPSKLSIITKGNFLILETRTKKGTVRKSNGSIFVTGWVDDEYDITGKVTITSDKKTYFEYEFSGKLVETLPFLFDLPTGPQFQGMPLPQMKR